MIRISRLPGLVVAAVMMATLLAISATPGTAATKPVLVKDIQPGVAGSGPYGLTDFNGTLVFGANTGVDSSELWRSNGTRGGTRLVRRFDVTDGVWYRSPAPGQFTPVDGTLFFTAAAQTVLNRELWKTDGTSRGTTLVRDIKPGSDTSRPRELTEANGMLFFVADDGLRGDELWKSDGSAGGTAVVKEFWPGAQSSHPENLINFNDSLFFTADDNTFDLRCGTNRHKLFKTDGTAAGTSVVFTDGTDGIGFSPMFLTNVNGTLFFNSPVPLTNYCPEGRHVYALWRSDGTHDGTFPFIRVEAGPVTDVNGTAFFGVRSLDADAELWKSDGTAAGTTLVKQIEGSTRSSQLANLTNVNGTLFFAAYDDTHGRELWKSDGTAQGTALVKDILPGHEGADPSDLTNVNGTLYFAAQNDTYGAELWKSDGTAAGTSIEDINPGPGHSFPSELTRVKNTWFFKADDGTHGYELWKIHNPKSRGR
jgi:ELWxxDGT repeat protein